MSLIGKIRALLRYPRPAPEPMPPGGHVRVVPPTLPEPPAQPKPDEPPDAPAVELAQALPDPIAAATEPEPPQPPVVRRPPTPFWGSAAELIAAGLSPLQAHQALYAPELLPQELLTALKEGRHGR